MAKKSATRRKTHADNSESAWTVAVSDAGDGLLAVAVHGGSTVRIIDVHTGTLRGEHAFGSTVLSIAWASRDSIAVALHSGSVDVYSASRNAVVVQLKPAASVVD
ncbi:hypothetical protein GGI21_002418, partial [Coemansia aciculifera]